MRVPSRVKFPAFLLAALALAWGGGLCWFIGLIPTSPPSEDTVTDAIVVLTGGSGRLERGFELLAENRAPRLFISGVEDGVTLASLLRKKEYLPFAGRILPDRVELGYQARSTIGNAEETALWVARQHVRSIRLVTGNYHMPRSIFELHDAAPALAIVEEPVFPSHFAHNEWWRFAGSIRLVISEYHKFIASVIVNTLLVKP